MIRSSLDHLRDIAENIERIERFIDGMTCDDDLKRDDKTLFAVIRSLEIIGEAAKHVSPEIQSAYPEIPWSDMARTRDRLIHHYFGVDVGIVWQTITKRLPPLASPIALCIANEEKK